ncbi:putative glucan endo-1,3-beta-glucosidase bg3 [Asimina triloba]
MGGVESIGICYGMLGNNLPSRSDVVQLYKSINVQQMRIYGPDEQALNALRRSNIQLILDVPRDQLRALANQAAAADWVRRNIRAYVPDVRFKYIAVGNEIFPHSGTYSDAPLVLPAMRAIRAAIQTAGLQDQIKVSTAVYSPILTDTFPPANTRFTNEAAQHMQGILSFLAETGAPLLANVYPYFSKKQTPSIPLPYALFTQAEDIPGAPGYRNLFDAMVDGFYFAMEKLGASSVPLVVSESGWPSGGHPLATAENARTYNQNLINHVKGGTPKKRGQLETYIFAMFNENQKRGDADEKFFGLFNPDKSPAYNINFG